MGAASLLCIEDTHSPAADILDPGSYILSIPSFFGAFQALGQELCCVYPNLC